MAMPIVHASLRTNITGDFRTDSDVPLRHAQRRRSPSAIGHHRLIELTAAAMLMPTRSWDR